MSEQTFDIPEFLERVQDDKELLLELLNIYEEDYKGKRKQLEEAILKGQVQEVRNIAHSLKGASGNISAKKLRLLFMQIEDNTKAENLHEMQSLLTVIDAEHAALVERMNEVRAEYSG